MAVPVAATVNQDDGMLYVQSPLPDNPTPVHEAVVLLPLDSTMSITTARPEVCTRQPPAASVATKLSHKELRSTYTVAVLRMLNTLAARLGSTEYVGLVANSVPPAVSVPATYSPTVPVVPGLWLDTPTTARVYWPVRLVGSGRVSAGSGMLTPSPRTPPVSRKLKAPSAKVDESRCEGVGEGGIHVEVALGDSAAENEPDALADEDGVTDSVELADHVRGIEGGSVTVPLGVEVELLVWLDVAVGVGLPEADTVWVAVTDWVGAKAAVTLATDVCVSAAVAVTLPMGVLD
jgi:hypothetical protein